MSKLTHVSRLAVILRGFTIAAMIILPVSAAGALLIQPLTPEAINGSFGSIAVSPEVTKGQLITAVALNLITLLILLLTLNEMRKLFGSYVKGKVLTDTNARLIQRIGQGFLALAVAPLIIKPLQSLLLTMANPPGQRSIAIGFDSDMLFFALSGGLIVVIGWAMREASDVAAENQAFV